MLAKSKAKRFASNCDSALYDLKSSRINKDLAHAANPHGSFKWKVPTYHRPYPLHIDYMNAPHGWRVPNFYEFSGEGSKTAVEHTRLYLAQLGNAGREDYMRIRNFPLSLTGTAFAWFTSLPECIVGSWIELEELFYEYFGKTNVKKPITIRSSAKQGLLGRIDSDMSESSAFKAKQHNITSGSITSQETSLATEKHGKHKKSARLDFSGVKGTIYLSSDYCIINEDQVPKSKKEVVDSVESAQPTDQPAKPTSSHTAGADASLDNSAPVVDCFLEMKNNIIQIKDLHFSDMIDKVQSTSMVPNSQSGHIISIDTSISNILASCVKRPIEEGIALVNSEIKLDYIGQPIMPYQEADDNILSKLKLSPMFTLNYTFIWVALLALNSVHTWSQMRYKFCNYFGLYNSELRLKNIAHADVDFIFNSKTSGKKGSCKGVAEWIDVKSDPFVCLALKPTPQKNRLKKSKYTFDFTFCDHVFDILLENNFIKIIDHNALPSFQNLEELTYCKWHNSFDHNTCNCNMFRRVIQSAIDKGRLRFSEAQQMDQLDSIGLDGKQVLNRLVLVDSLKGQGSSAQGRDVEPSSEETIVVHELQIEDTLDDTNVTYF
jgi:hypothetical protein